MMRARGFARGYWAITLAVLWVGGVACGGSGDDDDASNTAGSAGEDDSGGRSGSGGSTGEPDAGESDGSGATGAGGSGANGSSGGSGANAGTSSSAGTSSRAGTAGAAGERPSGNTEELLDEIGDACENDCDAQFALDCAPQNTNTLTCQLSCASATTQIGDFCLEEYRDYVDCRGDGGYDCVNDFPYQRSTCAAEQVAYTGCTQHIGCKRYCQKAIDEECIDQSFDDCVEGCVARDETLPEGCNYYQENIAYCQATSQTTCIDGGLSVPTACSYQVLSVAECVSDEAEDLCAGWCWAANKLGCGGEDCDAECAEKSEDATCGSAWKSLLDCGLFFGDAACETDAFTANGICDSEVSAYQTCIEGMPEE